MMKLTVLYGQPTNTEAFEQHYGTVHLPAVAKVPGVARAEVGPCLIEHTDAAEKAGQQRLVQN